MPDSPEDRLKKLTEAVRRLQTLQVDYVQKRRYLDPFSEIQERGEFLLKRPGSLRLSGELFLPTASGVWRKTGAAESKCADGKTLWIVRPGNNSPTVERRSLSGKPPPLEIDPLLGFFDPQESHLAVVTRARRDGSLLSLKSEGKTGVSYALRERDGTKVHVSLDLSESSFPKKTVRRTTLRSLKTETETFLNALRPNLSLPDDRFRFAPPLGARLYVPPPPPLAIGAIAPPIRLALLSGKTFDLAQYAGKRVVLDFWASWCRPCIEMFPKLQARAAQGVPTLLIPLYDSPENVALWIRKSGVAYPNLLFGVAGPDAEAVGEAYRVTALPTTIVIGPDGRVAGPEAGR